MSLSGPNTQHTAAGPDAGRRFAGRLWRSGQPLLPLHALVRSGCSAKLPGQGCLQQPRCAERTSGHKSVSEARVTGGCWQRTPDTPYEPPLTPLTTSGRFFAPDPEADHGGATRVLFVSESGVCRAPLALALFRDALREAGLEGEVVAAARVGAGRG